MGGLFWIPPGHCRLQAAPADVAGAQRAGPGHAHEQGGAVFRLARSAVARVESSHWQLVPAIQGLQPKLSSSPRKGAILARSQLHLAHTKSPMRTTVMMRVCCYLMSLLPIVLSQI